MEHQLDERRDPLLGVGDAGSRIMALGDGVQTNAVRYGSINNPSGSTSTPPVAAGATTFQTGLNMLNELEGAGLLGLPYATKLCGWISLGMMGVVGLVAGFTGYLLAMCMYDITH